MLGAVIKGAPQTVVSHTPTLHSSGPGFLSAGQAPGGRDFSPKNTGFQLVFSVLFWSCDFSMTTAEIQLTFNHGFETAAKKWLLVRSLMSRFCEADSPVSPHRTIACFFPLFCSFSTADRHLGSFKSLVTVHKDAMDILVYL